MHKRFRRLRFRSSRSQMFFKIGVLKNFAIFTGKHLCWSLFLIKFRSLLVMLLCFVPPYFEFLIFLIKLSLKRHQKQPPKYSMKKAVFKNFCNIHRKVTVLKSLFNKATGRKVAASDVSLEKVLTKNIKNSN